MGNNKFSPILIGVICLVLVAIIIFVVNIFSGDEAKQVQSGNEELDAIAPVIELSVSTSEENQEKVTITVLANTEDKEGIDYIELPDGTQVFADTKDYEVTENGSYEFKAVGKNGAEDTLSIDISNIREISSNNPYIPEGFEHVGGEVENGFIIQDQFGNQYVWVPVPTGILTRTTLMNSEYQETSGLATKLVNSVAQNYGFYIARFEASVFEKDGKKGAASISGQIPWSNVNYQEAYNASLVAAEIFGYTDVSTSLISSYAWDTTLSWLNQTVTNYATNTSYGNYSGTIYPTGATQSDVINNVCDMAGNVREWTTEVYNTNKKAATEDEEYYDDYEEYEEVYYDEETGEEIPIIKEDFLSRVVRGGSASINKIANSRNGYPENLTDGYWGFRTVLYKVN